MSQASAHTNQTSDPLANLGMFKWQYNTGGICEGSEGETWWGAVLLGFKADRDLPGGDSVTFCNMLFCDAVVVVVVVVVVVGMPSINDISIKCGDE